MVKSTGIAFTSLTNNDNNMALLKDLVEKSLAIAVANNCQKFLLPLHKDKDKL